MREVALPKLLLINVVLDIYGLLSHIAPKLLDEFARHACPSQVGCEPMSAAVWAEMVLHLLRVGIV